MLYTTLKIGDKDYKLKFTAKSIIEAEKKIGTNPLNVMVRFTDGLMPSMQEVTAILWGALTPLNQGIKYADVLDLYDSYIEDGNSFIDMVTIIAEVFKTSGFLPGERTEKN